MLGGWAYSGAIYGSSRERTAALDGWLWHYNHRRRHQAIGRQTPITRLNNLLGTYSYPAALDAHRRLLRALVARHGGREVDTEGDGCFIVFPRADAAVSFAAAGQTALAGHPWPEGVALRVRIGIHAGCVAPRRGLRRPRRPPRGSHLRGRARRSGRPVGRDRRPACLRWSGRRDARGPRVASAEGSGVGAAVPVGRRRLAVPLSAVACAV